MADRSPHSARPLAPEDATLVRQVQEGDTRAFGRLVTKYQDRVVNLCWRMCGNLDDAHDIAQEAFINAYEKISFYRFEASFYTWLFRIAVNQALTHRRRSRRPVLSLHDGDGEMRDVPAEQSPRRETSDSDQPVERLAAREMHEVLLAALEKLDDDQRAVIVLRDVEGLDYRQIAEVLEISAGTVKSRLHRARMALRELIVRRERPQTSDDASRELQKAVAPRPLRPTDG